MGRKNKRKQSAYYRRLKANPKKLISGNSKQVCSAGGEHTSQIVSRTESVPTLQRGQIWFAEFGSHPGTSVQEGCRPALIVSNDMANQHSSTVTVIPMTTKMKKTHLPTHVLLSQPDVDLAEGQYLERSMILAEQVTTIGKDALVRYVGEICNSRLKEVESAVLVQMSIVSAAVTTDDTLNSDNLKREERNSYGS